MIDQTLLAGRSFSATSFGLQQVCGCAVDDLYLLLARSYASQQMYNSCTTVVLQHLLYICCTTFVVHHLLYTICCTTVVLQQLLYNICCTTFVVQHLLYNICCTTVHDMAPQYLAGLLNSYCTTCSLRSAEQQLLVVLVLLRSVFYS